MVEHDFWGGNSFVFAVFGSRRGLHANNGTIRKSAMPHHQAFKNELNEAIVFI